MKTSLLLPAILCACTTLAAAQGTFIYDQQSSTLETIPNWGSGPSFSELLSPWGQSFTPVLNGIDFIRLKLLDGIPSNGLGASLRVDLREANIDGPSLASSQVVSLADGFRGTVDFTFSSRVPLFSGATYYFRPHLTTGDAWNIIAGEFRYAGGTAFYQGQSLPGSDYWFREGIIVPEPGTGAVMGLGLALLALTRRHQH